MNEQHCFEDCPACGGTGNLPTGAGDYNECGWSKYWDENQALRKRLEAVEFGLSQVDLNDMADEYELRDYLKYLMQAATGE